MESRRENSSSDDLRTGPATNLGESQHTTYPLTEQGHGSILNNNLGSQPSALGNNTTSPSSLSSSQSPSLVPISDHAYESSSGNPFQNQPLVYENVPTKGQGMTANIPPKGPTKSSDDDIPNNKGPEIQNPPVQVMERQGDSTTNSPYTFPSHVFARNNTNAPVEWSTASNESLFSIYMGNMSFSNEIPNFSGGNKYTELDKPSEMSMPDQPPNVASSQSHQPPAETTPVNKFNDISQRTAEMHVECSKAKATEAKAFETMREVIMETSRTNENAGKGGDDKNSNTRHQSDGSTQSFAFQSETSSLRDRRSRSEEKHKQHKQTDNKEQKETTNEVDETSKSTTNPTSKGWLSCFSCCS